MAVQGTTDLGAVDFFFFSLGKDFPPRDGRRPSGTPCWCGLFPDMKMPYCWILHRQWKVDFSFPFEWFYWNLIKHRSGCCSICVCMCVYNNLVMYSFIKSKSNVGSGVDLVLSCLCFFFFSFQVSTLKFSIMWLLKHLHKHGISWNIC